MSFLFAGIFPERVSNFIAIDIFGPLDADASKTRSILRKAVEGEEKSWAKLSQSSASKSYDSVSLAIETRIRVVATYPGKQTLSREAAEAIIARYCCHHHYHHHHGIITHITMYTNGY